MLTTLALAAYAVLGLIALALVLAFVGYESLFWLLPLPFYFFLLPVLGIVAMMLALIRQTWGLEWKLLVLLFFTATGPGLLYMMTKGPMLEYMGFALMVLYSVVALAFFIWHFLFEKTIGIDDESN